MRYTEARLKSLADDMMADLDKETVDFARITTSGEAVYWSAYFGTDAFATTSYGCFDVFERAFPAADGWFVLAALLAANGLLRTRPAGVLFSICAGSALIFLGLVDVLFNLENGMYAVRTWAMAGETFVNAYCLTAGPFAINWAWRHRSAFDV